MSDGSNYYMHDSEEGTDNEEEHKIGEIEDEVAGEVEPEKFAPTEAANKLAKDKEWLHAFI